MSSLSLRLLGPFKASYDGRSLSGFRTKATQALLIYLAAQPDQAHGREKLMALLWPGMPQKSAQANLRQTLYQLRQDVPEVKGGTANRAVELVVANRKEIQLNPAAEVDTDVIRFETLLVRTAAHQHLDLLVCANCRGDLEQAAGLYQGHFLIDFYLEDSDEFEEWAQSRREYYRRKVLDALEVLTSVYLRQEAYAEGQTFAERQLTIDDLRESAYRQLMELLAHAGRREEALAVYDRCRRTLVEELGMEPSARTSELYARILAGDLTAQPAVAQGVRGLQLREVIGEGAYGVIHRAFQPSVGRDVAVKVIRRKYANDPEFIRRFEAEAQTVARLEHPYIVPLYDYWRDAEGAYLVMRYVREGSLEAALKSGPWPPERTMRLVDQIASALAAAHLQGVVHRDLKPANILLDEAGNAYLTDFGIAKALAGEARITSQESIIGTLDYISPEQIKNEPVSPQTDIYSFGAVLYETLTGERPFADATVANLLYSHLYQPMPPVSASRPGLPAAVDDVLQKATAKRPVDRFDNILEMAAAYRQALNGGTGLAVEVTSQPRAIPAATSLYNPYKGLRAFQEADADDFFGRDDLVERLVARLTPSVAGDGRFLALVGPSGSGKSSAVRAGLIPALRAGAVAGSEKWFVAEMTPGSRPLEELAQALLPLAVDPPPSLVQPMERDLRGILRTIRRVLPEEDSAAPQLLLVIDQFEELFTLVADTERRHFFLDSLLAALNAPRSPLRLVITLRADFYDRPLQQPEWGQLLKEKTEVILPLSQSELTWSVREPARRMGVTLEKGLAERIVAEVTDQAGGLPLLQYALTELFDLRQEQQMIWEAYEEIGGVLGALGRRAEELYGGLDEHGQSAARQLFLRLVTIGESAEDTRRRVLRSELQSLEAQIDVVIDDFGRARLLTFDRDPLTREPTVEVAHEALLREWSRLRGWLDESRNDVRMQRLLAQAAAEWRPAGRDDSYLLHGSRLEQFAGWAGLSTVALTRDEGAFLEASLTDRQARRAEEEARRQRELETARQLARTEKARADEQARSTSRLRWLAAGLAVVFVVAVGAAVFARQQQQTAVAESSVRATAEANALRAQATSDANFALAATREVEALTNEELAISAAATAAASAAEAQNQANIAEAERAIAEEQTRLTRSRELALAALNSLETDPELSILLAMEALNVIHTREAEEALHQAILASRIQRVIGDDGYRFWTFDFSPDGSRLAAGGVDPETSRDVAFVWDMITGKELLKLTDYRTYVNAVALTPDGRQLLVAINDVTSEQLLTMWDIDNHALADTLRTMPADLIAQEGAPPLGNPQVFGMDLSADGLRLVTADVPPDPGELTASVWDMATDERLATLQGFGNPDSLRLTVGPVSSVDGRLVAGSSSGDSVSVWQADTGSKVMTVTHAIDASTPDFKRPVASTAISPDSTRLATAGYDGHVRIWEIPSGQLLRDLAPEEIELYGVAFSPDGTSVAVGGASGLIYIWDITTGTEAFRLGGHKGAVGSIAFGPDGQMLVSGSDDLSLRQWDLTAAHEQAMFSHPGGVGIATYSPDGSLVATGGRNGTLAVWDAVSQSPPNVFGNHANGVYGAAFSPDGTRLASASDDGTARLWDVASGEELLRLASYDNWANRVAYHPDGSQIAVAGQDGEVTVLDAETGELLFETQAERAVWGLAYDPQGERLAFGNWRTPERSSTVTIVDTRTWEELANLDHQESVWGLAFSPEGNRLAITGATNLVVWDLLADEKLMDFQAHNNGIYGVAWSPDGTFIVTGSADYTNKVWDAITGELRLTLDSGTHISLHPDGRQLLSTQENFPARVFLLDTEALIELARTRVTRSFSAEECTIYHLEACPAGP